MEINSSVSKNGRSRKYVEEDGEGGSSHDGERSETMEHEEPEDMDEEE